jgi:peptidoglycan/xylan/chitin deacetylase (PgdA/CDA1 family)
MTPRRLGWILTAAVLALGPIAWSARSQGDHLRRLGNLELLDIAHSRQGAVVQVQVPGRLVALSFDDGPDPRYTATLLRILRRFHAHATFFVVGRAAAAAPGLVRAELAAGDEVANHTYTHPVLTGLDPAAVRAEIENGRGALERAGAPEPILFRAPWGLFSEAVAREAAAEGELMVAWTATIEKAQHGRGQRAAVAWLLHRLHPGAILLGHDGRMDRSRTVRMLPLVLAGLRERGYRFVSVGELLRAGGDLTPARWRSLSVSDNPRVLAVARADKPRVLAASRAPTTRTLRG